MAYIGNTVQNQGFTPAIDYFSGNGVTVTFTLSRNVASAAQMIVTVDNVIQNPASAYTVSGNAITFTSAPLSGTNNIWVEYTSLITTYAALSQSPSVVGDITASGGYLATGAFGASFVDGTITDYVTGNGRVTVGPADGFTIYNGGTSARTALASWGTTGHLTNTGAVASNGGPTSGNSLVAGRVDSSNEGGQVDFCRSTDNTSAWAIDVYGNTSTPALRVLDNTAAAVRMQFDSSGNVFVGGTTQNTATKPVYSSTTAKAWVLFSYNGSSTSINGSFNVSSVARNGAFNYTVNFSSAMVDANYSYAFSGSNTNNGTGTNYTGFYKYGGSQTQSSFTFQGLNIYNGGANQSENVSDVSVIFFR